MGLPDYYSILQINPNASNHEVKRAFYILAKKYHPDTNNGNKEFEETFKDILNAYKVLVDSEKRLKYDQLLSQPSKLYYQNSPYEPAFRNISDAIIITRELFEELSNIEDLINGVNASAVFKTLNHILDPEFIREEVNTKDDELKRELVNNILSCYQFLPSNIIERIQVKVNLINYENETHRIYVKRIILWRKVMDGINRIITGTPTVYLWLMMFVTLLSIASIAKGLTWLFNLIF
jgi:hypothetical protein